MHRYTCVMWGKKLVIIETQMVIAIRNNMTGE